VKLALISDTHGHHWGGSRFEQELINGVVRACERERPDVLIDAGDYETKKIHDAVEALKIPVISITGNHDYYGSAWVDRDESLETCDVTIGGKRIVGATLWSNFRNADPLLLLQAESMLNDFRYIVGFTPYTALDLHYKHLAFLRSRAGEADVVVTHNGPTMRSVHERYGDVPMNYLFSSPLDNLVVEMGAKLWLHGHTHDDHDYMAGDTRVLCHPCGYPYERRQRGFVGYEPLFLEID